MKIFGIEHEELKERAHKAVMAAVNAYVMLSAYNAPEDVLEAAEDEVKALVVNGYLLGTAPKKKLQELTEDKWEDKLKRLILAAKQEREVNDK